MSIGLAVTAIGTERSITYPAQNNGVVGLKPTVGLVSRAGVVPVSKHKDTVGPITRTVEDAALVLSVIAGQCLEDPTTNTIPFEKVPDFVAACKPDALRGARIAVSPSVMERYYDAELLHALENALQVMESEGAHIVRDVDFVGWDYGTTKREEMPANIFLKEGLESYFQSLATNPHGIHTIADLISFMENTPEEEVEKYGINAFLAAKDEPRDNSSMEFQEAVRRMIEQGSAISKLLDQANGDALVVPTTADIPSDLGQNPAIAVPLGFFPAMREKTTSVNQMIAKGPNIPYSLSFVGKKFSDEKLIGIAYAFEQSTNVLATSQPCVRPTGPILSVSNKL
ncbi:amidase signature domain-containing protein [Dichotomopilus funicola]|uniref:Amidase signature domain-containing protein n=1 Tax=Dichotomopilus funicola TaxID=1934379 RepID=A0AAN6ZLS7_9PEZI|nr:amidase signature domain-containing protein [Dichotomopilus funicola]